MSGVADVVAADTALVDDNKATGLSTAGTATVDENDATVVAINCVSGVTDWATVKVATVEKVSTTCDALGCGRSKSAPSSGTLESVFKLINRFG